MAAQQVLIEVEGMKLEIDIDEDYYKIICKRVEENKPYHSSYEYEVIANGKPLEQELFINKPCVSTKICEHDKNVVLNKIRAEIREWYWQADKQELAKDPCVVDAMIDLFIRTIAKYQAESEEKINE